MCKCHGRKQTINIKDNKPLPKRHRIRKAPSTKNNEKHTSADNGHITSLPPVYVHNYSKLLTPNDEHLDLDDNLSYSALSDNSLLDPALSDDVNLSDPALSDNDLSDSELLDDSLSAPALSYDNFSDPALSDDNVRCSIIRQQPLICSITRQ